VTFSQILWLLFGCISVYYLHQGQLNLSSLSGMFMGAIVPKAIFIILLYWPAWLGFRLRSHRHESGTVRVPIMYFNRDTSAVCIHVHTSMGYL